MALRNLQVVITLNDKASKALDNVTKKLKDTGGAAKSSAADYTKFNRTLFSTAAFIGLFTKQLGMLHSSIEEGADLDRLESQYNRVLGDKGSLFKQLDNLTTTAVDKFEAMRQGVSLANLGIIHSSDQLAEIMAKAGTAAKLANKDSSEGLKAIGDFMKTGEVSQLEFLDVIAKTNPALQAQMAILHKAGGVMGGVISTQARLALGMKLLSAATKGHLQDQADLVDILKMTSFSFEFLRKEIGLTLGNALGPFGKIISVIIQKLATNIEHLRKTDKNFVPFIKNIVLATAAVLGLITALGTLRLVSTALSSLGLGLPILVGLFVLIEKALSRSTNKTKKFTDILQTLFNAGKGIWQLVTSFDALTGKGKISSKLLEQLGGKDSPLVHFVENVARVILFLNKTMDDIFDDLSWLKDKIIDIWTSITDTLGISSDKTTKKLDTAWSGLWLTTYPQILAKSLEIMAGIWAGSKLLKMFGFLGKGSSIFGNLFGGIASKIPGLNKVIGTKADGSATNPFHVIVVGSGVGTGAGAAGAAGGLAGQLNKVFAWGAGLFKAAIMNIGIILSSTFPELLATLGVAGTALATTIGVGVAAAIGIAIGKLISWISDKFQWMSKDGFKGDVFEHVALGFDKLLGKVGLGLGTAEKFKQIQDFKNTNDIDMLNKFRKSRGQAPLTKEQEAKVSGQKTLTSVPEVSPTNESMLDHIGKGISDIQDKDQRNKAAIYAGASLDVLGQKGQALTPESMEEILRGINQPVIEVMSKVEKNTRQSKSLDFLNSRR